jgi:hypothetical protein
VISLRDPRPEVAIDSLDFLSERSETIPFVVAITLE